ncbi:MAG: nickel/cobalt transporter [Variibacter sp.]|nr:nickel/cobalt transporter [Variibacter sp.]
MQRISRPVAVLILLAACLCLADAAVAQGNPFGVGRPPAAAPPPAAEGLAGWLLAKQAEFYRAMASLLRAAKADGSAAWGLLGVSFLYGLFHAAGPGHGKAVISSYLIANDETLRRGLVLSFASALMQALTAIAVVAVAAGLIGATAKTIGESVRWIEIASYALIALLGAHLLWRKGRAWLAAFEAVRPRSVASAAAGPTASHDAHRHACDGHAEGHAHEHHACAAAAAGHDHAGAHGFHGADCGHLHAPEPATLAGRGGWRRGLSAVLAVGLRPCSGAILVLVFALAQGLFWTGVAATLLMSAGTALMVAAIATVAVGAKDFAGRIAARRSGVGTFALRTLEVAAAALVLAFGVLLLAGYMASERLTIGSTERPAGAGGAPAPAAPQATFSSGETVALSRVRTSRPGTGGLKR